MAVEAGRRVEPEVYTGDYYLKHCHGHEDFASSGGREVGPRFEKALSLAGALRGRRVLDVGCGRGELVIQSALRGAEAWGIDYAPAAVGIAREAIDAAGGVRGRAHAREMDVKALTFGDGHFDAAFLMDVVEHLYPAELSRALDELHRVLAPGGRLIVHTSPNTFFERIIYPAYSSRVNEVALKLSKMVGYRDSLFNEKMLPAGRAFPRTPFECDMHVNEQSAPSLRRLLERHGFRVRAVEFWEPPVRHGYFAKRPANMHVLDFIRFLRPLSLYPPLSRYFCNHIWMTAERS
ncbi:MAG: class I SAM-dependent methyltransferase [Dehalococcoidia bacterium]